MVRRKATRTETVAAARRRIQPHDETPSPPPSELRHLLADIGDATYAAKEREILKMLRNLAPRAQAGVFKGMTVAGEYGGARELVMACRALTPGALTTIELIRLHAKDELRFAAACWLVDHAFGKVPVNISALIGEARPDEGGDAEGRGQPRLTHRQKLERARQVLKILVDHGALPDRENDDAIETEVVRDGENE